MFSFDGGGYTGSGARSGGLDGKGGFMAIMHPRETVTDHTRGQTVGGGQPVNYSPQFNFAGAIVKQEFMAAVDAKVKGGMQAVRELAADDNRRAFSGLQQTLNIFGTT